MRNHTITSPHMAVYDDGVMQWHIPGLRLVSEANQWEHWAQRTMRKRHQKHVVAVVLGATMQWARFPCEVTITRIAPRFIRDSDNAGTCAKHVRDQVAAWLCVDDADEGIENPLVRWHVKQRKGAPKQYAVEIRIERADSRTPPLVRAKGASK